MEVVITAVFWTALYNAASDKRNYFNHVMTRMEHIVPVCMLFLDFLLNSVVWGIHHIIFFMVIGTVYLCVNAAVTLGTGKPVYDIMTFKDYKTAIAILGILVLGTAAWFGFWGLGVLRHRKIKKVWETKKNV